MLSDLMNQFLMVKLVVSQGFGSSKRHHMMDAEIVILKFGHYVNLASMLGALQKQLFLTLIR